VSRPTKVLMLVNALYLGGGERFLAGLATNLPPERWDVTVCATRAHEGPLVAEIEAAGLRYINLGRSGRFDLAPFARLVSLLRRERFDVIHAHMFGSNVWGSIFGRLTRTPVVIAHEQTWSYEGQPLRRFFDGRVVGRLADAFVAVSTRDQERMIGLEHVPAAKTTYIPNAYMPLQADGPQGDLRAELGIDPGAPVAGTLAVLRAQKAIDVLLDAFAIVSKRIPGARLVIGGYGPMTEPWQAHAREIGIEERVHWLGMRRDGPTVLAGLDVAVMSSDFEGTPLFAFECMAARRPMVVTDVGGQRDIFDNGETALLVPPRDAPAMAEALETLLRDPERRSAMAEAAHDRLAEFTVEKAVERVEQLYERLLVAKGRPVPAALQPASRR
jgi:glycosyltransferase involved in cell wall biosynthesis